MTAEPMTVPASTRHTRRPPRALARVLGAEALALAIMSGLHLSGALAGGHKPFVRSDAGIAEAIIGDPADRAFHATMLPVLAITLIGLRRR